MIKGWSYFGQRITSWRQCMNYGYARVSTFAQNLDRQLEVLEKQGLDKKHIYTDKESGKDFNRTSYIKMFRKLKSGDVLFIKSIDRLGRNYSMILNEWRILTKEKGIDIVVIDMPLLDTRIKGRNLVGKFISDVVLQVLSFVAENERENTRQRQAEGIRIAKLKGIKFGRPPLEIPEGFERIISSYKKGEISALEAITKSGLTRGTFYRKLKLINK